MSTAHLQGQCKLLWVDLVLSYAEVSQSCKTKAQPEAAVPMQH